MSGVLCGWRLIYSVSGTVLLNRIGLPVMVSEENHVLRLVGRFLTSVM